MKLVSNYDTVTIQSDITIEDFRKVERYAPDALVLYKDKEPIYTITYEYEAAAELSNYGTTFNDCTESGKMFVTYGVRGTNTEEDLLEIFGMSLVHLKEIEAQVINALNGVDTTLNAVKGSIVINPTD